MRLSDDRIKDGKWQGLLSDCDEAPAIEIRHRDIALPDVSVRNNDHGWLITAPIPAECISDGVQTFTVFETEQNEVVGDFTLIAGEAVGEDMRVEMDLLRAELDMLKRAFRRHCIETQ